MNNTSKPPTSSTGRMKLASASKEKQVLRQTEVRQSQAQHRKKVMGSGQAPVAPQMPIDDKFIFGHYIDRSGANSALSSATAAAGAAFATSATSATSATADTAEDTVPDLGSAPDAPQDAGLMSHSSRYEPMPYTAAFEVKEDLVTSRGTFTCYMTGPHFSSDAAEKNENELIIVCLHGAGHSGLSWAAMARLLKQNLNVFAFDYRGHGTTDVSGSKLNSDEYAMGRDSLVRDVVCVLHTKFSRANGYKTPPPFVLVGHSLGGALAVHTTHAKTSLLAVSENDQNVRKKNVLAGLPALAPIEAMEATQATEAKVENLDEKKSNASDGNAGGQTGQEKKQDGGDHAALPSVVGIVVVDLVEGTALNSLIHMKGIINRRPKKFATIKDAIRYTVTNGMIRNAESAAISVPAMFVSDGKGKLKWRTDVLKSAPFWREWFLGLSQLFLTAPVSKMLMLADTDRLDKPLTIGQMQGKYQLAVMGNGVGHTVHEDSPQRVAEKIIHFIQRNQFEKMWKLNKRNALKHWTSS